jgi:hypothetical protein
MLLGYQTTRCGVLFTPFLNVAIIDRFRRTLQETGWRREPIAGYR